MHDFIVTYFINTVGIFVGIMITLLGLYSLFFDRRNKSTDPQATMISTTIGDDHSPVTNENEKQDVKSNVIIEEETNFKETKSNCVIKDDHFCSNNIFDRLLELEKLMRKQIATQNSLKADKLLQANNRGANRGIDEELLEIRMEELKRKNQLFKARLNLIEGSNNETNIRQMTFERECEDLKCRMGITERETMKNTAWRLANYRTVAAADRVGPATKDEEGVASPSSSPTTKKPLPRAQGGEPKKGRAPGPDSTGGVVKPNVPRRPSPSKYAVKPKKPDSEWPADVGGGRQTIGQKTKDALRGQLNRLMWR